MAESVPAEALRAFAIRVIGNGKRPRDEELAEEGDRLAGMVLDYLRKCVVCGRVAPAGTMQPLGLMFMTCTDEKACYEREEQHWQALRTSGT